MLAKGGVRGNHQNGGRLFVILSLGERPNADPFLIKKNLLGFIEAISDQSDFDFGPTFATSWFYPCKIGAEGGGGERGGENEEEGANHRERDLGFFGEDLINDPTTINNFNGAIAGGPEEEMGGFAARAKPGDSHLGITGG